LKSVRQGINLLARRAESSVDARKVDPSRLQFADSSIRGGNMTIIVRGSVDFVSSTEVIGWAFSPGRNGPVVVQAAINNEILGEAKAELARADLAASGVGDGKAGFVIKLYRPIEPIYFPFVVVKVDYGDAELPRTPVLGVAEFFGALFLKHPAAGRSRSVFGGLWIDRTDASALLRSKLEIGQTSADIGAVISKLLQEGVAIIELTGDFDQRAWRDNLIDRLGEKLEDAMLLPLLRAVLEDNPLVVRADWISNGDSWFAQPSANNSSPSPAECVDVIMSFGEEVVLDLMRESHRLPEFSPHGVSRYSAATAGNTFSGAGAGSIVDRLELHCGSAAMLGPGTLYRVRCASGSFALRILCLPARSTPLALLKDKDRRDHARPSKVRIFI
jgi:hypothetical protein